MGTIYICMDGWVFVSFMMMFERNPPGWGKGYVRRFKRRLNRDWDLLGCCGGGGGGPLFDFRLIRVLKGWRRAKGRVGRKRVRGEVRSWWAGRFRGCGGIAGW